MVRRYRRRTAVFVQQIFPLFAFNDWMDANIFFTMGKSMFSGRVLYRDVFDHKGPVLYFLYGIGWLMDHTGFTGVLILEVAAFAVFLAVSLDTVALFTDKAPHPAWIALPAAGIAASRAFSHGGSAEEFLLPFLAVALYGLLRTVHRRQEMPLAAVLGRGCWRDVPSGSNIPCWASIWCGRRCWRHSTCGRGEPVPWPAAAGPIWPVWRWPTLPWVVYFGVHGALATGSPPTFTITSFCIRATAAAGPRCRNTSGGRCGMPCLPPG